MAQESKQSKAMNQNWPITGSRHLWRTRTDSGPGDWLHSVVPKGLQDFQEADSFSTLENSVSLLYTPASTEHARVPRGSTLQLWPV